jgi:hypothetical protein
MKFCPVVPARCYLELPTPPHGMFAFANACYQQAYPHYGDYFRTYQATALQGERGPLIIDNLIYEGGEPLLPWDLRRVEDIMKPDFLIIPDVRGDMTLTCHEFNKYRNVLGPAQTGVLQGQTWIELEDCYKYMRECGLKKFAIPKDVAKFDVSRFELVTQLVAVDEEIEIHLLGGDWPYVDEGKCSRYDQVKSFDSAEPFNAALHGWDLAKTMPPKRPGGWENIGPRNLGDGFRRDFWRNIEVVERLAKCN